jgi:hypothetical protein
MKHFLPTIFLISLAFGQANSASSGAPSTPSIPVDQQNAQKARTLINQMIEALGGSAYMNIQDVSQEGRTYGFHLGQPEGVGVVFWRFYKYPDMDRVELTKKRDVVEIFHGNEGFEVTYKGTARQDPKALADYIRRREYSLDWVLRKWLNQPGLALFYEGATVAAEKDVQQVTLMTADNKAVTLYINSNTHLPVKKSYSWRDSVDKQRNVEDEVYDNYRIVQGIPTPFDITRYYNGDMSNQRFLNSVSYNKGLSDSMFDASITYDPNKPLNKR